MATASDHRHRHHRAAKSSPPANPETPSLSKVSAAKASAGAGLLGFSFSWGAHRRLRCSKDGAPVYDSAAPSPPQNPHTPSPENEKPKPPPQDTPTAGYSSRPQRPPNLRPRRYAHPLSFKSDGAGHALKSPSAPPQPPPEARKRKRGFAVALTKDEIARDFAAIRGRRPPSRPRGKKLTKELKDKIDSLCPGLTLDKLDLDNYKIDER